MDRSDVLILLSVVNTQNQYGVWEEQRIIVVFSLKTGLVISVLTAFSLSVLLSLSVFVATMI